MRALFEAIVGFTQPFFIHAMRRAKTEIVHMIGNVEPAMKTLAERSARHRRSTRLCVSQPATRRLSRTVRPAVGVVRVRRPLTTLRQ